MHASFLSFKTLPKDSLQPLLNASAEDIKSISDHEKELIFKIQKKFSERHSARADHKIELGIVNTFSNDELLSLYEIILEYFPRITTKTEVEEQESIFNITFPALAEWIQKLGEDNLRIANLLRIHKLLTLENLEKIFQISIIPYFRSPLKYLIYQLNLKVDSFDQKYLNHTLDEIRQKSYAQAIYAILLKHEKSNDLLIYHYYSAFSDTTHPDLKEILIVLQLMDEKNLINASNLKKLKHSIARIKKLSVVFKREPLTQSIFEDVLKKQGHALSEIKDLDKKIDCALNNDTYIRMHLFTDLRILLEDLMNISEEDFNDLMIVTLKLRVLQLKKMATELCASLYKNINNLDQLINLAKQLGSVIKKIAMPYISSEKNRLDILVAENKSLPINDHLKKWQAKASPNDLLFIFNRASEIWQVALLENNTNETSLLLTISNPCLVDILTTAHQSNDKSKIHHYLAEHPFFIYTTEGINHDFLPFFLQGLYDFADYFNNVYTRSGNELTTYEQMRPSFLPFQNIFQTPECKTINDGEIPDVFIYQWFGKAMPEEYIKNILTTHHFSEKSKIIIVTTIPKNIFKNAFANLDYFPDIGIKPIELISLNDLLTKVKPLFIPAAFKEIQRIIYEELNGFHNYAACSDLTRLLTLLVYGGCYLDTDNTATRPFEHLQQNHRGFLVGGCDYSGDIMTTINLKKAGNATLLSMPNHELVRKCILTILNNYKLSRFSWILRSPVDYINRHYLQRNSLSSIDVKRFPIPLFPFQYSTVWQKHGWRGGLTTAISGPGPVDTVIPRGGVDTRFYILKLFDKNNFPKKQLVRWAGKKKSEDFPNPRISMLGGIFTCSDQTYLPQEVKDQKKVGGLVTARKKIRRLSK